MTFFRVGGSVVRTSNLICPHCPQTSNLAVNQVSPQERSGSVFIVRADTAAVTFVIFVKVNVACDSGSES